MFEQQLDIDKIDREIIRYIQQNIDDLRIPDDVIEEIAERTSKSKEVIESRIIKLRRMKLLEAQVGLDLKEIEIKIARIDVFAKKIENVMNKFENCPVIANVLRTTGDYNISLYIAAPNTGVIEKYIDACLRTDRNIVKLNTTYIVDAVRKFIVPLIFDIEMMESETCFKTCGQKLFLESIKSAKK